MTPDSVTPIDDDEVEPPAAVALDVASARRFSEAELTAMLRGHVQWLDSDGEEGVQATLRHADLSGAGLAGARLERADLQGADLTGADLQLADLREADLRYACLRGANLRAAELQGANLRKAAIHGANLRRSKLQGANLRKIEGLHEARLRDSNLSDATGLLGDEFAGLDTTGATLPKDIAEFAGLAHVAELSRHTRGLFLAMIGACIFCWLTIATTTDLSLVTGTVSTPLPIIQTKVPISGFYLAAPIILLSVFLYLNLYLQKLWQGLAGLPAIFPDGRTLDQRAHPWLVTSLVRAHVPLLRANRPAFSQLDVAVSVVTIWWLVPFTLFLFWLRFLPRHDLLVSVLQLSMVIFSIGAGFVFYLQTAATLRGGQPTQVPWRDRLRQPGAYAGSLLGVSLFAMVFAVCQAAISGEPRRQLATTQPVGLEAWVPTAVAALGGRTFAVLTEMDVSTRPTGWSASEGALDDALTQVVGVNLQGRDLRHAAARGVFLAKADLREADLRGAVLTNASLQGANLLLADLREVNLLRADLRGARLIRARLQAADMRKAQLDGANLQRSNLEGAVLSGAVLRGAQLTRANLRGAKLTAANLRGATLSHANLEASDLRHSNLSGAVVTGSRGLTPAQLEGACGDARTRLPKGLSVSPCISEPR